MKRDRNASPRDGSRVPHARIALRTLKKGEDEIIAATGARSFRAGDAERWLNRVFRGHPNLELGDTLVATIDDRVAGHASGYRFTMSLAGRDVPVRGIAAVAVVPEFRRMGVADVLMTGLCKQMRKRGEPLSLLYPFRMSFYRKFGYGTVEWTDHARVHPSQLPASPLRRNVRHLERPKDQKAVEKLYEKSRGTRTGLLQRHPLWWERRIWERVNEGVVYVDPKSGKMTGYALYDVLPEPAYPRQHAHVMEVTALDADAYRGLIGYFEALSDQYRKLEFILPRGHAAGMLRDHDAIGLNEPTRFHKTAGLTGGGAMLRLIDVAAAFGLHPMPARNGARGRLGLDLTDPIFPSHTRGLDVTFGKDGATVSPGRAARERVRMSVASLAQVYLGGASARTLIELGFADGSMGAAALLDHAFEGPPMYLGMNNAF